jgi:hypothetical protein
MEKNFSFDFKQYDFWPIYETIKKYYPVGIVWQEDDSEESFYQQYPGQKAKDQLIEDNIHLRKNYQQRWGKVLKLLQKQVDQSVEDTSHPCYSGVIQLEKQETTRFILTKELHFVVSLLGPYYTLYGLDKSWLLLEGELPFFPDREEHQKHLNHYQTTHAITISPFLEYESIFRIVHQRLKASFPDYRFVPYPIYYQQLQGLYTGEKDSKGYIYQALFNQRLDLTAKARGDVRYGYREWLKEGGLFNQETQLQLAQKVKKSIRSKQNNQAEVSLHRVWQFKSLKRLPVNGTGMVNLPVLTLLDLTHPTTLIVKSGDADGELLMSDAYQVVDQQILIQRFQRPPEVELKYKIDKLTTDQLGLILHLSINKEGPPFQKDLAEFIYERVTKE